MHDMLKESRFGSNDGVTKKGRQKYYVEPGRSVTESNMTRDGDNEQIMETDHFTLFKLCNIRQCDNFNKLLSTYINAEFIEEVMLIVVVLQRCL